MAPGTSRCNVSARGSRGPTAPEAGAAKKAGRRQPVAPPRGELAHDHVTAVQRRRLVGAAVALVGDGGYPALTVAGVIGRAHVSRRTFYELFRDREDCFLAAFEETVETARPELADAYLEGGSWQEGVRRALGRMLALVDEQPALARLSIVEALGAGNRVLARRAAVMAELADVLDRGRAHAKAEVRPPRVAAEAMTGAVFAVVHARLILDPPVPVVGLYDDLARLVLLPYLGATSAAGQTDAQQPIAPAIAKPAPGLAPSRGTRSVRGMLPRDPLANLDMRLTYRTLVVLRTLSASPGISNRQIADRAGISDPGQVSKLLSRLTRLGLTSKQSAGADRAATNAWHLTARGEELERATRAR